MNAPTFVSSPAVRPVRRWADVAEAYRSAAMAQRRSARTRRPTVSLCISAFQAERHLQDTIDSCLAQQYPELELLIIDNNSSDATRGILEAVEDQRVQIIRNITTLPVADGFNLAVQQSRGRFVKLMCAGDRLQPDCVDKQAKALEANAEVTLVAAQTDHIDDDGNLFTRARGLAGLVGRHPGERAMARIVCRGTNPIGPPVSVMFRRMDFDQCGGCRGERLFPVDLDLWVRLLAFGDFLGVPGALTASRMRNGSTTQHPLRAVTDRTPARSDNR
jgi:glycosyltransferase involved in cell wall biosynthesis